MLKLTLNLLGKLFACTPTPLISILCQIGGNAIYYGMPRRKRFMLSNLYHAFPEKKETWRRKMAKKSCSRMLEMGLFVVASPFLSNSTLKKKFLLDSSTIDYIKKRADNKGLPGVFLIPHFTLSEALCVYPQLVNTQQFKVGVFYREFNQPGLEVWIKNARARTGISLLSRKSGLNQAFKFLKEGGAIGILFDQNAGKPGALSLLFNRIASTTDLPNLLVEKFQTQAFILYIERTGFWKGIIHCKEIALSEGKAQPPITSLANLWLENTLKSSERYTPEWLWFHRRWKTQDDPHFRYQLHAKRSHLKEDLELRNLSKVPKKTKLWFRLPNWLGDVIMAIPILKAIKKARPDAQITLLVQPHFIPLLKALSIGDHFIALPKKGLTYFLKLIKHRYAYADTLFLFTNSLRSELEGFVMGVPQRFGIQKPHKPRPFLSHKWQQPLKLNEATIHQTDLWKTCLTNEFGLKETLDFAPLLLNSTSKVSSQSKKHIGLIAGTENSPEKRWPPEKWQALIEHILSSNLSTQKNLKISLFGTPKDAPITSYIAKGFPQEIIKNLAGKTNLLQFAHELVTCRVVISSDTGGMHLANALGIPIIGLFGPTNPIRTGPIFESKKTILQPKGCSKTGGGAMTELSFHEIYKEIKKYL